jgi:hypothetical protein
MSEQPARSEMLRQLRSRLPKLPDPLEIIAEQVLGLESRIDFVAKDPRGQVVLVFLADRGCDLGLLADSLAQRSWMEPRVADWVKLAPHLGLRPQLGVRVLLLACHLDPRTIAAAKSLEVRTRGPEGSILPREGSILGPERRILEPERRILDLGICRPVGNGAGLEIQIDLLESPPPTLVPVAGPVTSRFRTGLRAEDLGS